MSEPNSKPPVDESETVSANLPEAKTRLRIRFTKTGDLRWISHRDLARMWERLLRRAGLKLAFSQGFHPKPRINFPSALALGIEALDEVVELEVLGAIDLADIDQLIQREMPDGMSLLSLESPAYGLGKARVLGASYQIALDDTESAILPSHAHLQATIDGVLSREQVCIDREGKLICCDPRDEHFSIHLDGPILKFSLPNIASGSVRPSELLNLLGLGELLEDGATLQRTLVHLQT